MTRSFRDPRIASEFDRKGYVVLPLLDADAVREAVDFYESNKPVFTNTWHTDMYSEDIAYRRGVHENVGRIVSKSLLPMLDGFRFVAGNFVVKEPSPYSTIPLHQDWTIADPTVARTINLICPLIDTDDVNGQLCVVPGSHHPPCRISYGPVDDLPLKNVVEEAKRFVVPLTQKAGEALIYDGRVLHVSGANNSGRVRIAFSAGFVPEESELRHYYRESPTSSLLEVYRIPESFFWSHKLMTKPKDSECLGTIEQMDHPLTVKDLEGWARSAGV